VRVVVADTGPLNYLVLIEAIEVLPRLFGSVLVPAAVRAELRDPGASPLVRAWAEHPPSWIDLRTVAPAAVSNPSLRGLDEGEAEALALAQSIGADLILIDDRAGVAAASRLGFATTGTLGVLVTAARLGLTDLAAAFDRLKATNFRYRPTLLEALLAQEKKREE